MARTEMKDDILEHLRKSDKPCRFQVMRILPPFTPGHRKYGEWLGYRFFVVDMLSHYVSLPRPTHEEAQQSADELNKLNVIGKVPFNNPCHIGPSR